MRNEVFRNRIFHSLWRNGRTRIGHASGQIEDRSNPPNPKLTITGRHESNILARPYAERLPHLER